MAQLESTGQREDQRDVLPLGGLLPNGLDVRRRTAREPAGQRRIGVDVELEQVEKGVGDHGDRAVDLGLDAVVELERVTRLVADREGDPLYLVVLELDVLAGFSIVDDTGQ